MTEFLGLDSLILTALREDVGTGDITTLSCVEAGARSMGRFVAKQDGVVCGSFMPECVYKLLGGDVTVTLCVRDGAKVKKGDVIATVEGNSRQMLTGERVVLNLFQHMSGIATQTFEAVQQINGTNAKIIDTRKTTPGLRELEKYAVRTGGGSNHRFGLSDGVLIKDNHIKAAGGITAAVTAARGLAPHTLKIEVETETLEQVAEALEAGAEIIMLDNMSLEQMSEAVAFINGRALTEASGNMGERDLREVAKTGVDFISIGALTHTVRALDISLKFE